MSSADVVQLDQVPGDPPQTPATAMVAAYGRAAVQAAGRLAAATTSEKDAALRAAAASLRSASAALLTANGLDLEQARSLDRDAAYLDRLALNEERIEAMACALEAIARLPDPVGRELEQLAPDNGLDIRRVATPIGVIGMVYESRPNVGADAGALCLKSGNAVILRCGSDVLESSRVIVAAMQAGLTQAGLPAAAIQLIDTRDRDSVTALLQADEFVDLVIPRGGHSLVTLVKREARVPTLLHLDGNCHTYVHGAADLSKAVTVIRNAKLRRTGICGATESLVVDRSIAEQFIPMLVAALPEVEIRADAEARAIVPALVAATAADWDAEYLAPILSLRIVSDIDEALTVIARHSSGHTEAILTEDEASAQAFLTRVDSAVVMHNASTQFADGGEFGMGAEIGIATGKLHARGPVGLEQLTTFKYLVRGNHATRS